MRVWYRSIDTGERNFMTLRADFRTVSNDILRRVLVQPPESAEVKILPHEDWSSIRGKPLVQGQNSPIWMSTQADRRMS
jgi:hypothetical protein